MMVSAAASALRPTSATSLRPLLAQTGCLGCSQQITTRYQPAPISSRPNASVATPARNALTPSYTRMATTGCRRGEGLRLARVDGFLWTVLGTIFTLYGIRATGQFSSFARKSAEMEGTMSFRIATCDFPDRASDARAMWRRLEDQLAGMPVDL